MDYPKEVINYAIDNKMTLEEAYKIYVLHGYDKEHEIEFDEVIAEEKEDEEDVSFTLSGEEVEAPEFNIKDELEFLSELEKKIKLESKINDYEVTQEDLDWVEFQLKQIDEMSDE